eukprot:8272411-Alexandrium_andersonii.AAC.1
MGTSGTCRCRGAAARSIRQLAMSLLIEAGVGHIGQAFRPRQFAPGAPGGAEAAAKAAQALADAEVSAVARLEGKSAFNSQGPAASLD